MRRLLITLGIFSILLLSSCKTQYVTVEKEVPVETVRIEYKTNTKLDSIYIHDSINVYSKGDTIFKDKIKLVYKDRLRTDTIHKVDSIDRPVYIKTTEIKEVNKLTKLQKFFGWSGFGAWLISIIFLITKFKSKIKII